MLFLYLDLETDNSNGFGLDVFSSKAITVQILLQTGEKRIYKDSPNLDKIKPLLETNLVIGHNLKFDSKFLKHHFGVTLYNVQDTYLTEIILSGGLYAGKHGVLKLSDLVFRYCGQRLSKEEQQGFRYGVPLTDEQKQYAINDLKYLPEIFKQQQDKIKFLGLEKIIDIEMKPLPAIIWLELSGIFVDKNRFPHPCTNTNLTSRFLSTMFAKSKVLKISTTEDIYCPFNSANDKVQIIL